MEYKVTNGLKVGGKLDEQTQKKVIDPVCSMEVKEGIIWMGLNGKVYSFCSSYCRTKFEKEPDRYMSLSG